MRYITLLLLVFACVSAKAGYSNDTSAVCGVWKGTSICQVRPSPCNDEVVVYYIHAGKKENEYTIVMNKIVNGVEEEMSGELPARYDAKAHKFTVTMKGYDAWNYTVTGNKMEGTLVLKDGTVYRVVKVERK